jgi:hypothetical protein
MRVPAFTADLGLLDRPARFGCPPPGLCAKASRFCRTGSETPWCNILDRCVDCNDGGGGNGGECVPTVTCRQDPATTDPRGQICVRDNCDGTASAWHTC